MIILHSLQSYKIASILFYCATCCTFFIDTVYVRASKMAKERPHHWMVVALIFFVCTLGLLIALIVTNVTKDRNFEDARTQPVCGTKSDIDLTESEEPGIFRDLTQIEHKALLKYLYSQTTLNLKKADEATASSSFIYFVEGVPPNKQEALKYLDENDTKPERWSKAVIMRGDLQPPQIEEYRVGPLPVPNQHTLIGKPINFAYRPFNSAEFRGFDVLLRKLDKQMSTLLLESFGTTMFDCNRKCLVYRISVASTHIFNKPSRHFWIIYAHDVEYLLLNVVDLYALVNVDGTDPDNYTVIEIWYGQQRFDSVEKLMDSYNNNAPGFRKYKIAPLNDSEPIFSNLRIRGKAPPKSESRPPTTYEPDGKRYSVRDQKIKYMDWEFNYRLVTSHGPALYDVRFLSERIAYEISLQEIATYYAAHNPIYRMANYLDSCCILGLNSRALVPGYDCPEHATFMPAVHVVAGAESPVKYQNAICVFEQNTGVPLHRHHSFSKFYGGLLDTVLTIRTILTVANYDFILDFTFHQTGAIEVMAYSTGYIHVTPAAKGEEPYGWNLTNNLFAPLHHYMFNYRVDLDIKGTVNRFEKLEILPTSVPNEWSPIPNEKYDLIKFKRNLVETENEARYNYDFNKPTYLLFHNDHFKTDKRLPKSYRLHPAGIAKSLLPTDKSGEVSVSWARQQVAVTKYKESELRSSSIYGMFDSHDPTVKFDDFINNENIIDQDLVAWVTLGVHHIPHTEDLPITPTPGAGLSFSLTPYNYFETCPSMTSRDALYVELHKQSYAKVQDTGTTRDTKTCRVKSQSREFIKLVRNDPKLLFTYKPINSL